MDIEFGSPELMAFYKGEYSGKQQFHPNIIRRFKDKVEFMVAAKNINDLSRVHSLNIERYDNRWSARINKQFRAL